MRGTRSLVLLVGSGALLGMPVAADASTGPSVHVVQTSSNLAQHLTPLPDRSFARGTPHRVALVRVNDGIRLQRIGGFGAALTDTAAWLLAEQAKPDAQAATMQELFGPSGIRLGFVRVPIGASDFTANGHPYSYDDVPSGQQDPSLSSFSISHDDGYILPTLRQALGLNPNLRILATPWSPPGWMKANGSLDNVRHQGTLLPSAAAAWAQYFVRFLQAYSAAGVNVGAISPQNEPTVASPYPGAELPAHEEARLVTQALAPALHAAGLHPAIYGGELGWGPSGGAYAKALATGKAARALTGIAWHCYFGEPGAMAAARRLAPRLEQILSECSPGLVPFPTSEIVMASLRNWASSVGLWNLALDPDGGPVQPPNSGCPNCTALLTVEEETGAVSPTINYFQLGQVSAFVASGARRVESTHFVTYRYRLAANIVTPGLDDVAFVNPDGTRVLVAYANSGRPLRFAVSWRGKSFAYTLPAWATVTFTWRAG